MKFASKQTELSPWVGEIFENLPTVKGGEWGGVEWVGGGWLNVRDFVHDSLNFFQEEGVGAEGPAVEVYTQGAMGLTEGIFSFLPKRLAKGEILEVSIPHWGEKRILNRRGWCLPIGNDLYRVGATYEWEELSNEPTPDGRVWLERLVREFTDLKYEVVHQVAGVRPIIRNSQPVVGEHPEVKGSYLLNGLGSKGCLYGPLAAAQLVELILNGTPIDEHLCLEFFLKR